MISRRFLRELDYFILSGVLVLAMMGLFAIYSASDQGMGDGFFLRQLLWIGLGVGVCFMVALVDYRLLINHALLLYGLGIVLLVAVLFFGTEVKGSKSWLAVAGMRFQPSEIVKVLVVLALARYLEEFSESTLKRRHFLTATAITLLPAFLIVLQGDLGTALTYLSILLGVLIVAGARARFLMGLMVIALSTAPVSWFLLKSYQKERILIILDPDRDPKGIGYQTHQSQIAIGSGGLVGKGLGHGLQVRLGFVPEVRTDFIFAILAEEIGLLGSGGTLLLYLFVLTRLLQIAAVARDRCGTLIVTGIASLICFHVVINVGMALGLVPPVGVPLSLVSYGGSVTITTFFAVGLALGIRARRFVYS